MPVSQPVSRTAPPKIRAYLTAIYKELTGFTLNKKGSMSSDNWDEANDTFSENAWELYDWTRSIFAGLSTGQGRNTHPHEYLSRLLKLIEEVEDGVRSRMNESKEEVIAWILHNYSLQSVQQETRIPVFDAYQAMEQHAPATQHVSGHHAPTQHAGHAHHGVSLPPPQVPPAPQQHTGLPPILPGINSPILTHPSIRFRPIVTREEEEGERSLSKSRRDDAHLGYGASMTPRKAAIYGLAGSGRARRAF
ncbi:hypothetical protein NBRC10513v2_004831 [Rhodotorula toruloides]